MGRPTLLSLPLFLLLPFACVSQQPSVPGSDSAAQPAIPTLQVYTRETIVDVVATDSHGHPIRNLHASDFTVKEDGKPQPIRSFSESGLALAQGHAHALPPGFRTNYQAMPLTGPVNIILIDALHLNFATAARALQATAAYARNMAPGTQVALLWLSSSGLHVLQGFTSDPDLLVNATRQQRFDIGYLGDAHFAEYTTVEGLTQLAQYVAPIRGRKNLLWITPGMPVPLLRDGGYGEGDASFVSSLANMNNLSSRSSSAVLTQFTGDPTLLKLYADEFGTPGSAAAYGASLALGNPGWSDPVMSLSTVGSSSPALLVTSGGELNVAMVHRLMDVYEYFTQQQIAISPIDPSGVTVVGAMRQLARANRNQLAQEVAEQSGGRAFFNSNDLPGRLAEAIDEGSHYYTVSYIPPRPKPDGHYHTIRIEVNLPGARLAYRLGYNAEDPRPAKQYAGADLIRTALEGKVPAPAEIVFDASLRPQPSARPPAAAPPQRKTRSAAALNQAPYALTIGLPQSQITPKVHPDGTREVRVQFAFDAYDVYGKLLGRHSQDYAVNLTPEKFQQFLHSPVIFHEQIFFHPGPLFLRVGVRDQVSNKVGTLEIPITIPRP